MRAMNTLLGIMISLSICTACVGNGNAPIRTISLADSGGEVQIQIGEEIIIQLESNPSTGFRWDTLSTGEPQVTLLEDGIFVMDNGEDAEIPPPPGRGGWQVYRLQGARPGETTFSTIYHRPWEVNEAPIETFSLTIVVSDS